MISRGQYEEAIRTAPLDEDEVDPPDVESEQPYFTSWMTEHLLRPVQARRWCSAAGSRSRRRSTPSSRPRPRTRSPAAWPGWARAPRSWRSTTGPARSRRWWAAPTSTRGRSTWQPTATASRARRSSRSSSCARSRTAIDPNSTWASQPKELPFTGAKGPELFKVNNYEDSYLGAASLWSATATSDNSVFAELGMEVKHQARGPAGDGHGHPHRPVDQPGDAARRARRRASRRSRWPTPTPRWPTTASGARARWRRTTPARSRSSAWRRPDGSEVEERELVKERVFPAKVGQLAKEMLSLVVTSGTGKAAQVGDEDIWGKTGTTENYGDAWFVGGNDELTVAVWVGYAGQGPVDGVRARRRPGGRRHLPGRDLQRLHVPPGSSCATRAGRARRRRRRRDRGLHPDPAATVDPTAVPEAEQPLETTPETAAAARRPRTRPPETPPERSRRRPPPRRLRLRRRPRRPRAARAAAAPRRARPRRRRPDQAAARAAHRRRPGARHVRGCRRRRSARAARPPW